MAQMFEFLRRRHPDAETELLAANRDGDPPQSTLELPEICASPLSLVLIAGHAEAVLEGDMAIEEGIAKVEEHHRQKIQAVISSASEEPSGLKMTKAKQLQAIRGDIQRVEVSLENTEKGDEVDERIRTPLDLPDQTELMLTAVGTVALSVWSIYSFHAFLVQSAVFFGAAAWGVACGPIMMAFVIKDPLSSIQIDAYKRILRYTYIALAGIAAIAWVATFGHEAGSAAAALGDINNMTGDGSDNTTRLMVRGIAQLFMELFGGAILFHRCFELWRKNGQGHDVQTTFKLRDKYVQESAALTSLREEENRLEHHVAQIDQWFATHPHIIEEYVSKAAGQFLNNINVLKGI